MTPLTAGSSSRDGIAFERAKETVARLPGCVPANAQIGWSPRGDSTVSRIRDPLRYAWPW